HHRRRKIETALTALTDQRLDARLRRQYADLEGGGLGEGWPAARGEPSPGGNCTAADGAAGRSIDHGVPPGGSRYRREARGSRQPQLKILKAQIVSQRTTARRVCRVSCAMTIMTMPRLSL